MFKLFEKKLPKGTDIAFVVLSQIHMTEQWIFFITTLNILILDYTSSILIGQNIVHGKSRDDKMVEMQQGIFFIHYTKNTNLPFVSVVDRVAVTLFLPAIYDHYGGCINI